MSSYPQRFLPPTKKAFALVSMMGSLSGLPHFTMKGADAPIPPVCENCRRPEGRPAAASMSGSILSVYFPKTGTFSVSQQVEPQVCLGKSQERQQFQKSFLQSIFLMNVYPLPESFVSYLRSGPGTKKSSLDMHNTKDCQND